MLVVTLIDMSIVLLVVADVVEADAQVQFEGEFEQSKRFKSLFATCKLLIDPRELGKCNTWQSVSHQISSMSRSVGIAPVN